MESKKYKEIKRNSKIQTIIMFIVIIISLIISFASMKLSVDYELLKEEKENLKNLIETQKNTINVLQENRKDLFIEIENLKFN